MEQELGSRRDRLMAALVDMLVYLVPYAGLRLGNFEVQILSLFGCLAYFVLQAYLGASRGQSVGKIMYGLQIVKTDTGENGGFVPNVLLRMVLNAVMSFIPFYVLADPLFIFREDRRCLHDFIAGTRVIKLQAAQGPQGEAA